MSFLLLQASNLQSTMMETMEAADIEKQKHNSTRMEAFVRLAKLEVQQPLFIPCILSITF